MHLERLYIEGFKRFTRFELVFDGGSNVIVGDNQTGKSTILEAISLVLTGLYDGRLIQHTLDPYLFNVRDVEEYFEKQRRGQPASPPGILIEAYLEADGENPELARLKGTNNTRGEDCPGLSVKIEVDSDYTDSLKEYARDGSNPTVLPVEFYAVEWRSFAGQAINARKLPFRAITIDTSLPRAYRGPNRYLAHIVNDVLTQDQRRELSLQYKRLRHLFAQQPAVQELNAYLESQGGFGTSERLSVQMDMSTRASWDSSITAHLNDLPFDYAGRGEQSRVQLRLAIAAADHAQILLIEEPENHLSHSNLNVLLDDIRRDCHDRQVIITTHSAFVLNKLGVDSLRLVSHAGHATTLTGLTPDTRKYFMKLPGYDTLRMILAKRCILVEGPSDELIVQRAYQNRYGRLPLEDGVDVIAVGSLAFKRFFEIAELLQLDVRAILDNDGDVAGLRRRYSRYLNNPESKILIFFDTDEACPTLEPQLLKANPRAILNSILGTNYPDNDSLLKYMKRHKTDCALRLFETEQKWNVPGYIANAIAKE